MHQVDLDLKGCDLCGSASCALPPSGPVTCADGTHAQLVTDCNRLCVGQNVGQLCATYDLNICVEAVCGSAGECGLPRPYVPPSCDDNNNCTIDTCDACANNCTGMCAHQPLNAPGCNLGPGVPCTTGFQCASTFCAKGACCNRACNGPTETCTLPGSVGQCVGLAPAPMISERGVLIVGGLLTAIGLWGLQRLTRRSHR
jgi:hypothetical protein